MKGILWPCWAAAFHLFALALLASPVAAATEIEPEEGAVVAPEDLVDERPGTEILVSETTAEPAAMQAEPVEEATEEVDDRAGDEPGVLPGTSPAATGDDTAGPKGETDRVITPIDENEPRRAEGRKTGPDLKAAKRTVPLETLSLDGVRPGVSTKDDLLKQWGEPIEVKKQHGVVAYKYRREDSTVATVSVSKGFVSTIVVQLDPPADPDEVMATLGVEKISSVEVADEDGEILGEAFPERGLLFGFAPDAPPIRVSQVIMESLEVQPFLLRAEAELDSDYARCLADAEAALELDPRAASAHAMRSRVYRQAGDLIAALQAAEAAVKFEPREPEWRLALAKVLLQLSDFDRAREQLEEALSNDATDPLVKAHAHLLMGDVLALASGQGNAAAVQHHQEAIRLLKPITGDRRARRRRKACDLLVDAHLHVAYSIGWGYFQHKTEAVEKWLSGAAALADELVRQGVLSPEARLRVSEQALAAFAGLSDPPDVSQWETAAMEQAKKLFDGATDPLRARQIEWQLGLALCDAVQIEQARHNYDRALDFGRLAAEHLKRADSAGRELPDHDFLLGQLYYRLGVIHAIGRQDHAQALPWYDQAVKLLEAPVPLSRASDPGRHGETFVSIGVSYWETENRDEAMRLTKQGVKLMEQAVSEGLLPRAALAVPYGNLASMYNELGDTRRAGEFAGLATKSQRAKK